MVSDDCFSELLIYIVNQSVMKLIIYIFLFLDLIPEHVFEIGDERKRCYTFSTLDTMWLLN